jgi:thiol-disulfide isomerase/thioredoxin
MKIKQARVFLALVPLILLSACAGSGVSADNESAFVSGDGVAVFVKPSDRKAAPALAGEILGGGAFTPANKVTVVNVWASWCSPCRAEAPLLEDFATRRTDVQFLGILTRDNLTSANAFVKRFKITYPTLVDDAILADFRGSLLPNAIPTTLIIDADGKVAVRISGAVTYALLEKMINKVVNNE